MPSVPYRRCVACQVEFLETKEFFSSQTKKEVLWIDTQCRSCRNRAERERRAKRRAAKRVPLARQKRETEKRQAESAYASEKTEECMSLENCTPPSTTVLRSFARTSSQHHVRAMNFGALSEKLEKAEIIKLYYEQNGRCYYCNGDISDDATLDHVVPVSEGGENLLRNIVLACMKCNSQKSTQDAVAFFLKKLSGKHS